MELHVLFCYVAYSSLLLLHQAHASLGRECGKSSTRYIVFLYFYYIVSHDFVHQNYHNIVGAADQLYPFISYYYHCISICLRCIVRVDWASCALIQLSYIHANSVYNCKTYAVCAEVYSLSISWQVIQTRNSELWSLVSTVNHRPTLVVFTTVISEAIILVSIHLSVRFFH